MNAGILRHKVQFYERERVQSASGFEREVLSPCYTARAYAKRFSPLMDRDGVVAREEFFPQSLVLKVRCCGALDRSVELDYQGARYIILAQERLPDRTRLIHCKRHDT